MKNNKGNTPPHVAAYNGRMKVIELFFEKFKDTIEVDATNNAGNTLLHLAALMGRIKIVKLLVSKGANKDLKNNSGKTPLNLAEEKLKVGGRIRNKAKLREVVKFLRQQKFERLDATTTSAMDGPKFYEGQKGRLFMRLRLRAGPEQPETKITVSKELIKKQFFSAVTHGKLGELKELIRKFSSDVDVNIKHTTGNASLHFAASVGLVAIGEFLIENGAHVNLGGFEERTPLHFAARGGHVDFVKMLLKHNADSSMSNLKGQTALHAALAYNPKYLSEEIQSNRIEVAKILIENDADIDKKDDKGRTALYLAAKLGNADGVRILLKEGANLNAITRRGKTAFDVAKKRGHENVLEVLEAERQKKAQHLQLRRLPFTMR